LFMAAPAQARAPEVFEYIVALENAPQTTLVSRR
jgi:hypothetical protein